MGDEDGVGSKFEGWEEDESLEDWCLWCGWKAPMHHPTKCPVNGGSKT